MAQLLLPERAAEDDAAAGQESWLVDVEFVGIDRALHNVLTEPVDAGDEYDIAETRIGIQGEDHPAGRPVGSHHLHHPDRERDLEMVEAVVIR